MQEAQKVRLDGLYGTRYGEVLLAREREGQLVVDVFNTIGFSDCPVDEFRALDAEVVAKEHEALFAFLNGPRHWMIDAIEIVPPATAVIETFGSLMMRRAATLTLEEGQVGVSPYAPREVARDTVFEFPAGRPLHVLIDAQGTEHFLQAYSLAVDPDQSVESLSQLGSRLSLPEGCGFEVRTPSAPVRVLSDERGIATVMMDELNNTYQRADRVE